MHGVTLLLVSSSHAVERQKGFSEVIKREKFHFVHVKINKPIFAPVNYRLKVILRSAANSTLSNRADLLLRQKLEVNSCVISHRARVESGYLVDTCI